MRTSVCYVFLVYAVFAVIIIDATREQRRFSEMKKFLVLKLIAGNKADCKVSYIERKASKGYEIFENPAQKYLIGSLADDTNLNVGTAQQRGSGFLTRLLRYFLTRKTLDDFSKVLDGRLSNLKTHIDNGVFEEPGKKKITRFLDVPPVTSAPTLINEKIKTTPIILKPESSTFSTKNAYPQASPPIMTFPRKYAYEQVNGGAVQSFSLDENSEVSVLETRKPLPPRTPYIDNRIKQALLVVAKDPVEPVQSNIVNSERISKGVFVDSIQIDAETSTEPLEPYKSYNHNPLSFHDITLEGTGERTESSSFNNQNKESNYELNSQKNYINQKGENIEPTNDYITSTYYNGRPIIVATSIEGVDNKISTELQDINFSSNIIENTRGDIPDS